MRTLVIIPTYDEAEDVVSMIDAVLSSSIAADVHVIDDSSPDGTSRIIRDGLVKREHWLDRVSLTTREGKGGRGGAVREGLHLGLENERAYEAFIEMDCDFSHDPAELPVAVALLASGTDIAIGARYPDGQILGWPVVRRIFSRLANLTARSVIAWSIHDYTNGFRGYSRRAAEVIVAEPQRHVGYIYLSESLAVGLVSGLTIDSFPIIFRNRERGSSSTDLREVAAAAKGIFEVARWYRRHRNSLT